MAEFPFMPGGSKFDPSNIGAFFKYALLKMNETYPFPPQIIKVDGTTIGTFGNFSASVGKPKSKKTFNLSAIVASALSGKMVLNYIVSLPTGKKRILYIDTEQSRPHCHRVLKRIIKMAQLPEGVEPQIDFLVLREFPPEQRRMIIDWSLQQRDDYSLVIVDGIRDLMRDINNPGEAIDVINDFMRWSSAYNLHIRKEDLPFPSCQRKDIVRHSAMPLAENLSKVTIGCSPTFREPMIVLDSNVAVTRLLKSSSIYRQEV